MSPRLLPATMFGTGDSSQPTSFATLLLADRTGEADICATWRCRWASVSMVAVEPARSTRSLDATAAPRRISALISGDVVLDERQSPERGRPEPEPERRRFAADRGAPGCLVTSMIPPVSWCRPRRLARATFSIDCSTTEAVPAKLAGRRTEPMATPPRRDCATVLSSSATPALFAASLNHARRWRAPAAPSGLPCRYWRPCPRKSTCVHGSGHRLRRRSGIIFRDPLPSASTMTVPPGPKHSPMRHSRPAIAASRRRRDPIDDESTAEPLPPRPAGSPPRSEALALVARTCRGVDARQARPRTLGADRLRHSDRGYRHRSGQPSRTFGRRHRQHRRRCRISVV
ncbi:hypothetical protein FQR65_LT20868 [Abscondita terminalis]|nr:hypothetical protein FQR65_LT20868 [Abscondita terminalis]